MFRTSIFSTISRRAISPRLALSLLALSAAASGCGTGDTPPPIVTVYPVKGKVLLADGSPLKGGHVYLVPTKDSVLISSGEIGTDGTFSITTGPSGEGAPPGEFKVRIEPDKPPLPKYARAGSRADLKPLQYPEKYTDEDASKLVVVVKAEPNQLEPFRLK